MVPRGGRAQGSGGSPGNRGDARNRAQRSLSKADYQKAAEASKDDRDEDALALLARAVESDPTNEMAISRLLNLLLGRDWPVAHLSLHHGGELVSGEFSTDGQTILTGGKDGSARLWNALTGAPLHTLDHGAPLKKATLSADGKQVATAGGNHARLWDTHTGQQIGGDLTHAHPVTDLAFEPGGATLATACAKPVVVEKDEDGIDIVSATPETPGYTQLWAAATGAANGKRIRADFGATHLAWHPKMRWLALGFANSVQLWDATANQPRYPVWRVGVPFHHQLSALKFDPSGNRLLAAAGSFTELGPTEAGVDEVGLVQLWDTSSGLLWFASEDPPANPPADSSEDFPAEMPNAISLDSWMLDAAFVSDDDPQEDLRIATATKEGEVLRWDGFGSDGRSGKAAQTEEFKAPHEMPVERTLPRGEEMITVANNRDQGFGYARKWNSEFQPSPRMEHTGLVTGAAWSPDGARILTIGDDGFAHVWWTAATRAEAEVLPGTKRAETEDSSRAALQAKYDEWNDANWGMSDSDIDAHWLKLAEGHPADDASQLSPALLSALAAVPTPAGTNRTRFLSFAGTSAFRAFRSADEQWLITSPCVNRRDPSVAVVWSLPTGKYIGRIPCELPVLDADFGRMPAVLALAVGYNSLGRVRLLTVPELLPFAPPISGLGMPFQVRFSPGAHRLAVKFALNTEYTGQVGVYDSETSLPLIGRAIYSEPPDDVLHFRPDGQRLALVNRTGDTLKETVYDIPAPAGPAPAWLPELARVFAHRDLDSAGVVVRLRDALPRRAALLKTLQTAPDSAVKTIALWLLSPPLDRRLSPTSSQTYRAWMDASFKASKARLTADIQDLPEQATANILDALAGLPPRRARSFGDAALLTAIDTECEALCLRMLGHFATAVPALEKAPNIDTCEFTNAGLRRLRGFLPPSYAEQLVRVDALLARVDAVLAKVNGDNPPAN